MHTLRQKTVIPFCLTCADCVTGLKGRSVHVKAGTMQQESQESNYIPTVEKQLVCC